MLKLKLQYFGHLMQRTDSLEKTLMLGRIEGGRRRGQQRMRLLDHTTDLMDMNLSKLWKLVTDREAWCVAIHGVAKSWTRLSDWTDWHPQISFSGEIKNVESPWKGLSNNLKGTKEGRNKQLLGGKKSNTIKDVISVVKTSSSLSMLKINSTTRSTRT